MPGISNINNIYNTNTKKISSKLSFDVDEVFAARVIGEGESPEEVILKLIDGWQFKASIEDLKGSLPNGLVNFKVLGFEEGKLILKFLEGSLVEEQQKEQNSIEDLLLKENIKLSKEDYSLLEKMIKHNIPLTKDNILKVVNLSNFMEKLKNNPQEGDSFIQNYIKGKGIDLQSAKGQEISNVLKGLFNELQTLTEEDLFILLESNIELTEENVKAFKEIFKESSIYNKVNNIDKELNKSDIDNKQIITDKDISDGDTLVKENLQSKTIENGASNKSENVVKNELISTFKTLMATGKEENISLVRDLILEEKDINGILKNFTKEEQEMLGLRAKPENTEATEQSLTAETTKNIKTKPIEVSANKGQVDSSSIKEQINSKTNEIKDIVKNLIDTLKDTNNSSYDKIIGTLKNNINNFKMFNTISNEYYYLDLPLNFKENECDCKIIIKDERGKGKKIDSSNVKIATSISTANMDIVDAYITLKNSNMEINIKTIKEWVNLLDKGKNKLIEDMSSMGYNIFIKVEEKAKVFNISNCREFFNDNNLNTIDIKA
ncbi:hypothetical protein EXN65_08340 [Clostridium botulinum]|uniref:Rhoptry protein n=2 Tax=Clostridium botulinum TaxID=1491 RepID=A0A846HST6_CLOBO|nr:hypothetical protein [Clostridium botulinum]ACQ54493.1 conserved hypothetical protein [Clostridium botulinum Ba4 str. 657]AJE09691.1 hypothetical protein T259_195 [Clostridium botulinum CDC_1436]AXG92583.1 hypothetical protein AGE29_12630 [Clostridium botulinum]EDT86644.1 conserved hypothetical protein [Clostridium botulinum Bf]MBY6759057.1 hypothetical protein [Clostridium botulinum]